MLAKLLSSTGFTVGTTFIGGALAVIFGTWLPLMTAVLILQGADILTGVLVGRKKKEISSTPFFDGLKKKVGMWILVILANVLDTTFLGGVPVLKSAVCTFLLAGEGLSLIENVGLLGAPIPPFITDYLEKLRDDSASSVDASQLNTKQNKGDAE
ncbi:hypothetical protein BH739_12085 [Enterococcus casseliflavus]|nr:hypothetical protein BH739_12085 [Enterococcus casseliflavus]